MNIAVVLLLQAHIFTPAVVVDHPPGRLVFTNENYAVADSEHARETMIKIDYKVSLVMDNEQEEVCSGGSYTVSLKYKATPLDRAAMEAVGQSMSQMSLTTNNMQVAWALKQQGKPLHIPLEESGEISVRLVSPRGGDLDQSSYFDVWNSIDPRPMAGISIYMCKDKSPR